MSIQNPDRTPVTEAQFANSDGRLFVIDVEQVDQEVKRWEDGSTSTATTVHFKLTQTHEGEHWSRTSFKDKRLRIDRHASKQETMRAFELLLDAIWAFGDEETAA
jgi:hypothetical protein